LFVGQLPFLHNRVVVYSIMILLVIVFYAIWKVREER